MSHQTSSQETERRRDTGDSMQDRQRHRVHELVHAEVRRQRARWTQNRLLEVDAATILFPIAESRGFRTRGSANFGSGFRSDRGWLRRRTPAHRCAEAAAETRRQRTSEGAFGTGANSARIARLRPHETLAKTKMSTRPASISRVPPPAGSACSHSAVPTPRSSCRARFPPTSEKLVPGTRRSRACTTRRDESSPCSGSPAHRRGRILRRAAGGARGAVAQRTAQIRPARQGADRGTGSRPRACSAWSMTMPRRTCRGFAGARLRSAARARETHEFFELPGGDAARWELRR